MKPLLLALVLTSLSSVSWALDPCAQYGPATSTGTIAAAEIDESSGLAASRTQAGVLWTHNDSGDEPRIFAVSMSGAALGTWTVPGAEAVDWEDMAIGPCGTDSCIYVADIGNNSHTRDTLSIYRFREPQMGSPSIEPNAEVLRFNYPDGERLNAEALMVGANEEIWVFSKESGQSRLFYAETLHPDRITELLEIGNRAVDRVTAADLSPDYRRFVVRGYDWALEFDVGKSQSLGRVFVGIGHEVLLAAEPQGESIAYTADGLGLLTTSEEEHEPVYAYDCLSRGARTMAPPSPAPSSAEGEPSKCSTTPGDPSLLLVGVLLLVLRRRRSSTLALADHAC